MVFATFSLANNEKAKDISLARIKQIIKGMLIEKSTKRNFAQAPVVR